MKIYFSELYPLVSSLSSMLLAQLIKCVYSFMKDRTVDFRKWFSSGGMPSSHSALVCAMSTAVGLQDGFTSSLFSVCVVFSLIVLYDAAGVRQVVGNQAVMMNQIIDELVARDFLQEKRIKELLGHTPLEVAAGAVLGILVSLFLWML